MAFSRASFEAEPGHERGAPLTVFCFPHAGGRAASYVGWLRTLGAQVVVRPVELPGRGARFDEEPVEAWEPLIAGIADDLALEILRGPYALFGHSMGALVAFELARHLRRVGEPLPRHLFVSGQKAAHLGREPGQLSDLDDVTFVREIAQRFGGLPQEILESEDLLALIVPSLRADFVLLETYQCAREEPFDFGITAFGGMHDRTVAVDDLQGWGRHTHGDFAVELLDGGHFFVQYESSGFARSFSRSLRNLQRSLAAGDGETPPPTLTLAPPREEGE